MRKALLAVVTGGTVLLGPALPSVAQEEPPRGPCNRGTMHAHHTVPHENVAAHAAIPHC